MGERIGRVIRFLFTTNRAIWFEKDLTENDINWNPHLDTTLHSSSTEQTIKWLLQQRESWIINKKEIDTARQYNHIYLNVQHNNSIIGSIKIGVNKIYITDFDTTFTLPKEMAFIYDTFVIKKYRDKGIATFLINEASKLMKAKGYKKIGCHIPPWNIASIKAYERIGFKKLIFIRFIQLLGIPFTFSKYCNREEKNKKRFIGSVKIPYD